MTGSMLREFLEQYQVPNGCTLGKRVEWVRDMALVQSHAQGEHNCVFHEQLLRIIPASTPDPSILGSIKHSLSSGFIFTNHGSRTACSEILIPLRATHAKQPSTDDVEKTLPASSSSTDESRSDISSVDTDFGFNNEEMQISSLSSVDFSQKDKNPDLPTTSSVSVSAVASPWNNTRHCELNATDPPPSRQRSVGRIPPSGVSKAMKRKARGMNLGISIDKSKKSALEKGASVWHAAGRSLEYMARKGTSLPVRGVANDIGFSEEMEFDLGKGQTAELEVSDWNMAEKQSKYLSRSGNEEVSLLGEDTTLTTLEELEYDSGNGRAKRRRC
jgi:hypothetical protein